MRDWENTCCSCKSSRGPQKSSPNLPGLDQSGCFVLVYEPLWPNAAVLLILAAMWESNTALHLNISILEMSHAGGFFGSPTVSRVSNIPLFHRLKKKKKKRRSHRHTHITPHAELTWPVWVIFSLTWDASSLADVTLNNTQRSTTFVRWLNVMSSQRYFNLSQTLGIRGGQQLRGPATLLLLWLSKNSWINPSSFLFFLA